MKKVVNVLLILLVIWMCFNLAGCSKDSSNTNDKPTVAVSIVPQETFVRAVAGDLVNVVTMIPPGRSPENYAPTPREIEEFSKAAIYFTIGVPTEKANILPKCKDLSKNMKTVSLENEVGKIYPDREFAPGSRDPHIWLSPKRARVMVEVISKEFSALDAANKSVYENNAKDYMQKLDELDNEIRMSLSNLENKSFIVYHPALGYFADDYGLKMYSLEKDGKEATPRDLQDMIDKAKQEKIKVIFYQAEIDSKQSKSFADEIGGKTEQVAPLASDYIENLKKTAQTFAKVLK